MRHDSCLIRVGHRAFYTQVIESHYNLFKCRELTFKNDNSSIHTQVKILSTIHVKKLKYIEKVKTIKYDQLNLNKQYMRIIRVYYYIMYNYVYIQVILGQFNLCYGIEL